MKPFQSCCLTAYWVDNVNTCKIKAKCLTLEFKACRGRRKLCKNAAENVLGFTVCGNATGLNNPVAALLWMHSFLTKLLLTSFHAFHLLLLNKKTPELWTNMFYWCDLWI